MVSETRLPVEGQALRKIPAPVFLAEVSTLEHEGYQVLALQLDNHLSQNSPNSLRGISGLLVTSHLPFKLDLGASDLA